MTTPMPVAWSNVAREYARHIMPGFEPAARALCQFTRVEPGEHVLDIACGPGTASLIALELGAGSVTGVDYASGMIAVARERAANRPGLTFVEGDVLSLPVPDGAFDVAVSSFGLIFAPDPVGAVREMGRAVRPGGRAGLLAWLQGDVTGEYYDLVYRHVPRHPSPHDPYDWGRVDRAVAWFGASFRSIESRTIAVPLEAESPEAAWEALSRAAGRVAAGYATLAEEPRRLFDAEMHRYFTRYRQADGSVYWPRQALMLRGRKPVERAGGPGEVFV